MSEAIKNTILDIRNASIIPSSIAGAAVGGLIGCYLAPETKYLPDQSNKEYVLSCCINIFVRSGLALVGVLVGYFTGPMVVQASPFLITTWLFKRYS